MSVVVLRDDVLGKEEDLTSFFPDLIVLLVSVCLLPSCDIATIEQRVSLLLQL
jgi:hypothetical protein